MDSATRNWRNSVAKYLPAVPPHDYDEVSTRGVKFKTWGEISMINAQYDAYAAGFEQGRLAGIKECCNTAHATNKDNSNERET